MQAMKSMQWLHRRFIFPIMLVRSPQKEQQQQQEEQQYEISSWSNNFCYITKNLWTHNSAINDDKTANWI